MTNQERMGLQRIDRGLNMVQDFMDKNPRCTGIKFDVVTGEFEADFDGRHHWFYRGQDYPEELQIFKKLEQKLFGRTRSRG